LGKIRVKAKRRGSATKKGRRHKRKREFHTDGGRTCPEDQDQRGIAERLDKYRVEQLDFKTVYAFAKALKKSQSGVKEWLRKDGENTIPDAPALITLSRDFRIDLNWLLTGEGSGERRLKNG
jgi:hypothetical protein